MKRLILNMTILLLCSCATLNSMKSTNPIIGKWKLVSMDVPKSPSVITYSTVDVILEFKPCNILTVQCLRQDNNCNSWNSGDYPYLYIDSNYGTKIKIGNTDWWYSVSEKKLMIGNGPVDGVSYYFEKI